MRLQVLHLPDDLVDGQYVPRFALILDEYAAPATPAHDHSVAVDFNNYAVAAGAKCGMVFDRRVEIVGDVATDEVVAEVVKQLDGLIAHRINDHMAARNEVHHHHAFPGDDWRKAREDARRSRVETAEPVIAPVVTGH